VKLRFWQRGVPATPSQARRQDFALMRELLARMEEHADELARREAAVDAAENALLEREMLAHEWQDEHIGIGTEYLTALEDIKARRGRKVAP
jgi:hypothetical protein